MLNLPLLKKLLKKNNVNIKPHVTNKLLCLADIKTISSNEIPSRLHPNGNMY